MVRADCYLRSWSGAAGGRRSAVTQHRVARRDLQHPGTCAPFGLRLRSNCVGVAGRHPLLGLPGLPGRSDARDSLDGTRLARISDRHHCRSVAALVELCVVRVRVGEENYRDRSGMDRGWRLRHVVSVGVFLAQSLRRSIRYRFSSAWPVPGDVRRRVAGEETSRAGGNLPWNRGLREDAIRAGRGICRPLVLRQAMENASARTLYRVIAAGNCLRRGGRIHLGLSLSVVHSIFPDEPIFVARHPLRRRALVHIFRRSVADDVADAAAGGICGQAQRASGLGDRDHRRDPFDDRAQRVSLHLSRAAHPCHAGGNGLRGDRVIRQQEAIASVVSQDGHSHRSDRLCPDFRWLRSHHALG